MDENKTCIKIVLSVSLDTGLASFTGNLFIHSPWSGAVEARVNLLAHYASLTPYKSTQRALFVASQQLTEIDNVVSFQNGTLLSSQWVLSNMLKQKSMKVIKTQVFSNFLLLPPLPVIFPPGTPMANAAVGQNPFSFSLNAPTSPVDIWQSNGIDYTKKCLAPTWKYMFMMPAPAASVGANTGYGWLESDEPYYIDTNTAIVVPQLDDAGGRYVYSFPFNTSIVITCETPQHITLSDCGNEELLKRI